ncbi:MAG: hypothetical protein PHW88_02650 [Bacteroidales bacterium]|jgi:hypothetical protein|nr:hypothetical protein [Bacteroidales bacterium]MDD3104627.1 hypothetical protein [Bacteroidales bacterium]MDD3549342.1 hypothetical protein [Bacteroidales bacterium]MDD4064727.1 hypothetical protein [Bacteroidales bacterium]
MTILDITLQPIYDLLGEIWNLLFGGAGEWADNLFVVLNHIWDIFQGIFTFVITSGGGLA